MPRSVPRITGNPSQTRFLDTTGRSTLGIGICDRCGFKFPLGDLASDPNTPSLKLCAVDRDDYDPYRMPARSPDPIKLPFNRPDQPLESGPDVVDWLRDDTVERRLITEQGVLRITEQGLPRVIERGS